MRRDRASKNELHRRQTQHDDVADIDRSLEFRRMTLQQRTRIRKLEREKNIDIGELIGISELEAAELIEWMLRL